MYDVVLLLVIGTSIWVYFDARSIGDRNGQMVGGTRPVGWLVLCLLLWIVGFPLYLTKRNSYKHTNMAHPSTPIGQDPPRKLRQCPFCAEDIRSEALKCKHCGSAVEPIRQSTLERNPIEEVLYRHREATLTPPPAAPERATYQEETVIHGERRIGTFGIVMIGLLGILLFAGIVAILGPSDTGQKSVQSGDVTQESKVATSSPNSKTDKVSSTKSTSKTASATSTPVSASVQLPQPKPQSNAQLLLLSSRGTREHGFSKVSGQVKNLTNRSLENVVANVSFFDSKGDFIKSADSLIDYNPILPGQVSPFEVITSHNPEMEKFSTEFKLLFGGTLSTEKASK